MLAAAPAADAVERTATPATLASVFASAGGGDTILLASGDYGTFHGAIKGGLVTLTPQPGATVSMDIDFNPASNIAIDGVTITDAFITGTATKSITIRNSDFPGQIWLDTRELHDSDVTLANDVFHDWNTCASCGEARVFLTGGSQPSGVTIRDSKFYGGLSDGIQNGSYGTKIIGNEFHDITPGSPEGVHADAIQLYGSSHTVIRANYMHDMPEVPFIMAADGTDHELIEDNVVEGSSHGYPYITLFSDDSSIVRHNTFADGSCAFNLPCGILRLGAKDSDDPGHGTVVKDNILSEISTEGSTTIAERSHNLLAHDGATSPGDLPGKPTYAGGPTPDSYAGYRLESRSLGKSNASDGTDRGARIDLEGPPPTLSVGDVSKTEGDAGTSNADLTVTLSAAAAGNVTVNYATSDGTATQPSDYAATAGTLTFTPGQTAKTVSVAVTGDAVGEPDETLAVDLSTPGNATIADGHGVATIVNDDAVVPDTTAPQTKIDKVNRKQKRKASFSFSSSEAGSSFECALDRGTFASCTSPKTMRVKKGTHTFSVRATGVAGVTDQSPATYSWKVDKKRTRHHHD